MSEAYKSIKSGLEQAIAHAKNEPIHAVVHDFGPMDVKSIRRKVGMTQNEFASSFGISLGTLRHWERGDRKPRGPARVLLSVLDSDPESVLNALKS